VHDVQPINPYNKGQNRMKSVSYLPPCSMLRWSRTLFPSIDGRLPHDILKKTNIDFRLLPVV
jgi:hypothetical protein